MAHFAQLDDANVVLQVIVIDNAMEENGAAWCAERYGGRWIQTSYNGNFRKNFASLGFTYDEGRDAFIPAKAFPSWVLNEETCTWIPPVPHPGTGPHRWIEETLSWEPIG